MTQKMKKLQTNTRLRTGSQFLAAAVATCFVTTLNATNLPTGGVVAAGSASFNQVGNTLNVTNSNGTVINWNTFSIGAGYTTNFIQPSASSSVLNRVLSSDPSVLLGTLTSNGRVFLINPNGIYVGAGARIDVASFTASTLNLSDANFLANKLQFDATPGAGAVVNRGNITTPSGGSVFLVAPNVSNEGIITTPRGETILAAGQKVTLLDTATPGVSVEITGAEGNATNLGQVVAEAGRIGIAGVIVRNSGTLNASSVVNEGGRIFLKASQDAYVDGSGRIVTTGSKGGKVEVLGNRVAVMDNAGIDASGSNGGGTILIGGDFQGKNPDIQNSATTYFGPDASIKADATDNGNGGKVIVWADDTTRAYGRISARGGANGGNGGLVETSGHKGLDVAGIRVDTRAPQGSFGDWLLDPVNVTITDYGGYPTYGGGVFAPITNSTIYAEDISISLGYTNVTIQTDGGSGGAGNILVTNAHIGGNSGLSLLAYGGTGATGNIDIQNSQIGINGTLELVAGWDGSYGVVAGKGNINVTDSKLYGYGGADVFAGGSLTITAVTTGTGIAANNGMNVDVGGNILIQAGDANGAYAGLRLEGYGTQSVRAGGDIILQAGNANYGGIPYGGPMGSGGAGILNWGYGAHQEISAHSIEILAGATGHDNSAGIQSWGSQSVSIYGGHLLVKAGGDNSASVYGGLGSFNNQAELSNQGPGDQSITVYGGGSIEVRAGNGTGTLAYSGSSNNRAEIFNSGSDQLIDFVSGGTLSVYGGAFGTDNYAEVGGYWGSQSIGSSNGLANGPDIVIYGGASGGSGGFEVAPGEYEFSSNDAGIHLEESGIGIQNIQAKSIYIKANGNAASYGGAGIGAPTQNISVYGGLTLEGGASNQMEIDGAPAGAAYIGNMYGASINLNVGGSFVATGGSGTKGAVLIGSLQGDAYASIQSSGGVTLTGNTGGVMIGTADALGSGAMASVYIDSAGPVTVNGGTGGVKIGAAGSGAAYISILSQAGISLTNALLGNWSAVPGGGSGNVMVMAGVTCPDGCYSSAGGGNIALTSTQIKSGDVQLHAGSSYGGGIRNGHITVDAASSIDAGGLVVMAADGNITVNGALTALGGLYGYAGIQNFENAAGPGYMGYSSLNSEYGGNISFGAGSSVTAAHVELVANRGWGDGSTGNLTQNAGATLHTKGITSLNIYAAGNVNLDGANTIDAAAPVTIYSGYDKPTGMADAFAGKHISIGTINAPGSNVYLRASGAILDGNAATPGALNITANTIDMVSQYGGAAGGLAISMDTAAYGGISASTSSFATYGGISIRNAGAQPGSYVSLHDYAAHGGGVTFTNTGDILNTGVMSFSATYGGDILVHTDGNMTVNGGSFAFGQLGQKVVLDATGSMNVTSGPGFFDADLTTTDTVDLRLASLGMMTLSGNVGGAATHDITLSAPSLAIQSGGSLYAGNDLSITTANATEVFGYAGAARDFKLTASALTVDGGDIGAGNDLFITTPGAVSFLNGGYAYADNNFKLKAASLSMDNSELGGYGIFSIDVTGNASVLNGSYIEGYGDEAAFSINAGGDVMIDNSEIHIDGRSLSIKAGGSVNVVNYGELTSHDYTVDGGGGLLNVTAGGGINFDMGYAYTDGAATLITGGAFSMNQSGIFSYNGGVNIGATGVALDSSYISAGYSYASAPTNVEMVISGGDLTLDNGSHISAANDVLLTLSGSTAVVSLNNNSTISTEIEETTHINFRARSSGGVLIDGVATTTTNAGGSGFYAMGNPASIGSGLDITYGSPKDVTGPIIDKFFDNLTKVAATDGSVTEEDEEEKQAEGTTEEGTKKNEQKDSNVGQCV